MASNVIPAIFGYTFSPNTISLIVFFFIGMQYMGKLDSSLLLDLGSCIQD